MGTLTLSPQLNLSFLSTNAVGPHVSLQILRVSRCLLREWRAQAVEGGRPGGSAGSASASSSGRGSDLRVPGLSPAWDSHSGQHLLGLPSVGPRPATGVPRPRTQRVARTSSSNARGRARRAGPPPPELRAPRKVPRSVRGFGISTRILRNRSPGEPRVRLRRSVRAPAVSASGAAPAAAPRGPGLGRGFPSSRPAPSSARPPART